MVRAIGKLIDDRVAKCPQLGHVHFDHVARHDPPIWLEPGDVIEVNVPELGTLRNTVVDEFPDGSDHTAPEPQ